MRVAPSQVRPNRRDERFLKSVDTCRIATVDSKGYPHCVPVGYFYHDGLIYVATVAATRKARNILQNPKCSAVVDVVEHGRGRGLVFQGEARLVTGKGFSKLKKFIENRSGWHLDTWDINGHRPDSFIVFTPRSLVEIGEV